jgi:hypothetical protein
MKIKRGISEPVFEKAFLKAMSMPRVEQAG